MARSQEQSERTSDGDEDEQLSDSGSEGYDSGSSEGSSSSDGDEEGSEDEEDVAAVKKQRVQADIDEMRRMMVDMDAVRARLQQRFAAKRQAKQEQLDREDREHDEQDATRRRAEEEALCRYVEASVQTEASVSQQQMNVSQQNSCRPHLTDGAADAALSAVDGGTGFVGAAPKKARPAGLSLYDLVKASGTNSSRKDLASPVHQADQPASTAHYSHFSTGQKQHQDLNGQNSQDEMWQGASAQLRHDQDSVVGEDGGDASDSNSNFSNQARGSDPARDNPAQPKAEHPLEPPPHHYDENSASVSNSLVSSDAGNRSAVFPDLIRQRDYKFNAAALLSTGKRVQSATNSNSDDKTDEQREMEAIQCLLFGRGVRR